MGLVEPNEGTEAAPERDYAAELDALKGRVEQLERQIKIFADGFEFAANEVRPLYGFGALALIFDAIAKKFKD